MEKAIRVRLLNREYPLRIAEGDERRTRAFASYVEARLQAFRAVHADQPELTAALITALSLAEEVFALREEIETLRRVVDDEAQALALQLDEALSPPSNGR